MQLPRYREIESVIDRVFPRDVILIPMIEHGRDGTLPAQRRGASLAD